VFTIVTLTFFPNGQRHYREYDTPFKSNFDSIVDATFKNPFRKAAYLVDSNGKLIDSYIKD